MLSQVGDYDNYNGEKFNVGLYLRLSKEDDTYNQSESILNQKDYLSDIVIKNGWTLVDTYVDDGFTGTNFDRPGFNMLLNDIEEKKINLVITKDLSRLGRDYIKTGYYIEQYFPEHGVRFIAVNDGIDTFSQNNSNNDLSPFKSVMNDIYAKDISKKVRSTMDNKRANGKFIGAFAPYGYVKSPENKNKLVIDPETSPIIKQIFKLYLSGYGYAKIANILNDEEVPPPSVHKLNNSNYKNPKLKSCLWTHETVSKILSNPTYAGNLAQNKYYKVNYKLKKLRNVPRDKWVVVENTHEPIVDLSRPPLVFIKYNFPSLKAFSACSRLIVTNSSSLNPIDLIPSIACPIFFCPNPKAFCFISSTSLSVQALSALPSPILEKFIFLLKLLLSSNSNFAFGIWL